jgi:hypothetical protein
LLLTTIILWLNKHFGAIGVPQYSTTADLWGITLTTHLLWWFCGADHHRHNFDQRNFWNPLCRYLPSERKVRLPTLSSTVSLQQQAHRHCTWTVGAAYSLYSFVL